MISITSRSAEQDGRGKGLPHGLGWHSHLQPSTEEPAAEEPAARLPPGTRLPLALGRHPGLQPSAPKEMTPAIDLANACTCASQGGEQVPMRGSGFFSPPRRILSTKARSIGDRARVVSSMLTSFSSRITLRSPVKSPRRRIRRRAVWAVASASVNHASPAHYRDRDRVLEGLEVRVQSPVAPPEQLLVHAFASLPYPVAGFPRHRCFLDSFGLACFPSGMGISDSVFVFPSCCSHCISFILFYFFLEEGVHSSRSIALALGFGAGAGSW